MSEYFFTCSAKESLQFLNLFSTMWFTFFSVNWVCYSTWGAWLTSQTALKQPHNKYCLQWQETINFREIYINIYINTIQTSRLNAWGHVQMLCLTWDVSDTDFLPTKKNISLYYLQLFVTRIYKFFLEIYKNISSIVSPTRWPDG